MADVLDKHPLPATLKRGEVAAVKPQEAKKRDAQADAAIQYAKDVHDWSTLKIAVEQKLKDQTKFVDWWGENVTPNRHSLAPSRNPRPAISVEKATKQTGISASQVSRWLSRLKLPDEYRDLLYGAAYAKAMAERTDQRGASGTGENDWHTPLKKSSLRITRVGSEPS